MEYQHSKIMRLEDQGHPIILVHLALKYYQDELELSTVTASHTVLLNRKSLREHSMNILLRKKIMPGFGLFAG